MAAIDSNFQSILMNIFKNGIEYTDKSRDVTRLQIPSYTFKHSFDDGFPLLGLKETDLNQIIIELIWFLRGDNDIKFLNDHGVKIWNKDAYNWYVKEKPEFATLLTFEEFSKIGEGSVGQNYSRQWRAFNGEVDQIRNLVEIMSGDIMNTRLKVNAWNPSEIYDTALPPCHSEFQVIGVPLEDGTFGFELHWNQRSTDVFLGLPFNIASYAVLAKFLEGITGIKALGIEGTLKCVHLYENQIEGAVELLKRDPYTVPTCNLIFGIPVSDDPMSVDDFINYLTPAHFSLANYRPFGKIPVKMLAPKKL